MTNLPITVVQVGPRKWAVLRGGFRWATASSEAIAEDKAERLRAAQRRENSTARDDTNYEPGPKGLSKLL